MWTARLIFLWLFAAAASFTDIRCRKVPNRLVVIAAAGALTLSAAGGWSVFIAGLAGMTLGFMLLFPAFLLHMVGGGDVKSLAVIGLAAGPGLLWVSFLRGAAAGGLAAMLLLALRFRRCGGRRRAREPEKTAAYTLPYACILSLTAALSALLL
jgi:Flp pilus assembly protein protease CpaA